MGNLDGPQANRKSNVARGVSEGSVPYVGHMSELVHPGTIPEFTIGDRLRKARELTGLEQGPFADELGIARGTVGNYEHGRVAPRKVVLKAWAMRTGVPFEWLATGVAPTQEGPGPGVNQDLGRPAPPAGLEPESSDSWTFIEAA